MANFNGVKVCQTMHYYFRFGLSSTKSNRFFKLSVLIYCEVADNCNSLDQRSNGNNFSVITGVKLLTSDLLIPFPRRRESPSWRHPDNFDVDV